jgi:hypothetical protein
LAPVSWANLEQELGKGWLDGVHPDDKAQFFAEYFCATEKQCPFEAEYRLLRHDGVYRWILEKAAPYYDQNGNLLGYCGSCIDITEQKEQNQKLKLFESAFNASRNSIVITDASNDNALFTSIQPLSKLPATRQVKSSERICDFCTALITTNPDLTRSETRFVKGKIAM